MEEIAIRSTRAGVSESVPEGFPWVSANGARSCAILFSLIETAKESKLDPCRYLIWVLKEAPKRSCSDPD